MSLFSDGLVSNLGDLEAYESSVLDTAANERIDLTVKSGVAQKELGVELAGFLTRHLCTASIDQVVVTDALRQWHALHTLTLFYRDAYSSQLNDRYHGRLQEYERLAKAASDRVFESGIGIVFRPVQRATLPILRVVSGAAGEGAYYIKITWVDSHGTEGAPSEAASIALLPGQTLEVTTAEAPADVAAWIVYAGMDPDHTRRQTETPLQLDSTWTLPETLGPGPEPGDGQQANYVVRRSRVLRRG